MYEALLQRLDESDVKFAKQESESDVKFAKQESVNGELQRTIAELSTNVARVSYTSSFMTPA
jgi:hypothetical protein